MSQIVARGGGFKKPQIFFGCHVNGPKSLNTPELAMNGIVSIEFLLSLQEGSGQNEGHRGGQGDSAQDPHRQDPGHQEALLLQVRRLDGFRTIEWTPIGYYID